MNQKQSQTSTPPNLLAGLDIGTTKVCMVVALVEGNELEIIGSGVSPSQNFNRFFGEEKTKVGFFIFDYSQ